MGKYSLLTIVELNCQLRKTIFNVRRGLSLILTDKTKIRDSCKGSKTIEKANNETIQLQFDF